MSGETANLGVATSTAVEMLDQRDSRHILGSTNWVGQRVPHHGSVIGKVFLAEGALPLPAGRSSISLRGRSPTRPSSAAISS